MDAASMDALLLRSTKKKAPKFPTLQYCHPSLRSLHLGRDVIWVSLLFVNSHLTLTFVKSQSKELCLDFFFFPFSCKYKDDMFIYTLTADFSQNNK